MKGLIKKAKEIMALNLINPTSEGFYDVDGEVVKLTKKRGRTVISCSCTSCTRFCNDFNICSRKLAVLLFEAQDQRAKKLSREMKEHAKECEKSGFEVTTDYLNCRADDVLSFI